MLLSRVYVSNFLSFKEIMQKGSHSGSVLGGVLLVTGCCIGAGMLGLPVMSALTGFYPTLAMFIVGWLFMAVTGLLLLEVNCGLVLILAWSAWR